MGGQKIFTIVRAGEVLGRFSRREIRSRLDDKSLKPSDKFKDPIDLTWKPLKNLVVPGTSKSKASKKPARKGPRSELDRSLLSAGPDIFERRSRRKGSFDIDAPCNICTKCRVKYDTDDIVRWVNLSCPMCGSTSFQGQEIYDSDRALDSVDRFYEYKRYRRRGAEHCFVCCDCGRRYSPEEKLEFAFGLCPWCGSRHFRELGN
jgi:hypothetical protein